jgi:hypothetical protein
MRRIFLFLFSLLITFGNIHAQTPHITGKIEVIMSTGQITCDFVITNIPDLGKDYQILLNKGFNIKAIKDLDNNTLSYDGFYNGKMKGEGISYIPLLKDSTYSNPKKLHITYTGAFPIYKDTLNFIDFKGLIAFNGKTLRAADQSKWYPIVYDVKNDQLLDQVTYDITVKSSADVKIYINGDLPKQGPIAKFSSQKPIAPLLFIGNYKVQETASALFLNTFMDKRQLNIFEENVAAIKAYYHRVLNIPYAAKNIFIEHQPVEKFKNGRSWAFATYPSIAFAGAPLGQLIDDKESKLKNDYDYQFLSHEIAHYYFGNILRPNSTLAWFFLESTAEYLSFKASEAKYGKTYSNKYLTDKVGGLKNLKVVPLSAIDDMNKINGNYRYHYGPLLLRGLEQIIGENRMFNFLQNCLAAKNELTDYAFFKRHALKSGITEEEWKTYEKEFIQTENATSKIKITD